MTTFCEETRNRIRVSVAAYAYEIAADPIMSDADYDTLCRAIDPTFSTGRAAEDEFFATTFSPDTGMWIHSHPDLHGIRHIYEGHYMGMEAYQNRRSPKGGREDFPTQPWATRALIEHVLDLPLRSDTVWEPAANRGYMVRPLAEYFATVIASDLHDYGMGYPVIDFLNGPSPTDYGQKVDWIITNPPFNLGERFIHRALEIASVGVAMFVRSAFLEGKERYESIYSKVPPSIAAQFSTRVPLVQGRVDEKAATAMPYMWLVWYKGENEGVTRLRWIPPCRKELEREGDYTEVGTPFEAVGA